MKNKRTGIFQGQFQENPGTSNNTVHGAFSV